MAKRRIEGSFVALITPMNEDGSVDFAGCPAFRFWRRRGFGNLDDWHRFRCKPFSREIESRRSSLVVRPG